MAHAAALRLLGSRTALAYAQVVGDLVTITALVYITSGTRSGFLLLYPMAVLAATLLVPRRGALWLAALATALYAGLMLAVRTDLLSHPGLADVRQGPAGPVVYPILLTRRRLRAPSPSSAPTSPRACATPAAQLDGGDGGRSPTSSERLNHAHRRTASTAAC